MPAPSATAAAVPYPGSTLSATERTSRSKRNAGSTTATSPSAQTIGADCSIVARTLSARFGSSEYRPFEVPSRAHRDAPLSRA